MRSSTTFAVGHPYYPSKHGKNGKQSEEHKRKRSEAMKGKNKGKVRSFEFRKNLSVLNSGSNSHLWKGGIYPKHKAIRKQIEYRLWRDAVFARDNWTCQKTGVQGGRIVAHHVLNFSSYPELRFAIDNGVTLSKEAHNEFHSIYGIKDNTKEQLEEYLSRAF